MSTAPFRHLIVPIDGSTGSDVAIEFALRLVGPTGELTFANAVDVGAAIGEVSTPYGGDASIVVEALEAERRDVFAAATARAQAAGVASRTVGLNGPAISAIAELSERTPADAIVMGTHGRRGLARVALGSVAAGVLRHAALPTFVVRAESRIPAVSARSIRRIVVAVDASEAAAAAAAYALKLAASYGAEVVFVHAGTDGLASEAVDHELERLSALAATAGLRTHAVRASGKPADAIATTAAAVRADLVAIGTHGRTGADRLVLGSVAEGVIVTSAAPVLVVHAKDVARVSRSATAV